MFPALINGIFGWQGLGRRGWRGAPWSLFTLRQSMWLKNLKSRITTPPTRPFLDTTNSVLRKGSKKTRRQQLNHLHLAHDSIEHAQLNTRLNIVRYRTVDGHLQSKTSLTHGYLIEQRPQKPHNTVRETNQSRVISFSIKIKPWWTALNVFGLTTMSGNSPNRNFINHNVVRCKTRVTETEKSSFE